MGHRAPVLPFPYAKCLVSGRGVASAQRLPRQASRRRGRAPRRSGSVRASIDPRCGHCAAFAREPAGSRARGRSRAGLVDSGSPAPADAPAPDFAHPRACATGARDDSHRGPALGRPVDARARRAPRRAGGECGGARPVHAPSGVRAALGAAGARHAGCLAAPGHCRFGGPRARDAEAARAGARRCCGRWSRRRTAFRSTSRSSRRPWRSRGWPPPTTPSSRR